MSLLYADANAGIPASKGAIEAYQKGLGLNPKWAIDNAQQRIAKALGAQQSFPTSGGTQANALAIDAVCNTQTTQPHVVTTAIEHPAVAENLRAFARAGHIDLTEVAVNQTGRICTDAVLQAIRPATRLVSIIAVGNETGVVQPIKDIAQAIKQRPSRKNAHQPILHTDAVQAVGRIPIHMEQWGVDLLTLSGHKIGAVGGVGALVSRQPIELAGPLAAIANRFSNGAGFLSLAAAVEGIDLKASESIQSVRDRLECKVCEELKGVEIIGKTVARVANTSCIRFFGCQGEAIMMALDDRGFSVSTGSACSTGCVEPSPILRAMGFTKDQANEAVRFSLMQTHTNQNAQQLAQEVVAIVTAMRHRRFRV